MIGELPKSLNVNGIEYDIRTDFRDVLNILLAFDDPNLSPQEKTYVCLYIMYMDFEKIPPQDYKEAAEKAMEFIDHGTGNNKRQSPRVMDWEQDECILFPAINRVAGFETREKEYIHWWTFVGYYLEIREGLFSNVVAIRAKKKKGKKLEKWEQEFYNANVNICKLREKLSDEEKERRQRILDIIDGKTEGGSNNG